MADQYLTRPALADFLGISEREITNLVKEHDAFPSRMTGRSRSFPRNRCRAWYLEFKQREAVARAKPTKTLELDEARAKKTMIDTDLAELELEAARGRLIPREIHEQRVEELANRLASRVKNLSRYVGDVQGALSAVEAQVLLERIGDDLLRALVGAADELETESERDDASAA